MKTFTFLRKKYTLNIALATTSTICSQSLLGFYEFEAGSPGWVIGEHDTTFTAVSGFDNGNYTTGFINGRLAYSIGATNL